MAKFNYKIDETLLPNVWVTWNTTKGGKFNERYWLNCQTGKKKNTPESWMYYPNENTFDQGRWNESGRVGVTYRRSNDENIWVKNGCKLRYAYMKYHKNIDMIEMAVVEMPTTREDGPHHWRYAGDRVFVNKNKQIFNENGITQRRFSLFEWHSAYDLKQVLSILQRVNSNDKMLTEFKKFLGKEYFVIGNGRCVNISYIWDIQTWATTTTKTRLKGKKQTDLDKLVAIPLGDVTHLYSQDYYVDGCIVKNIAYFEYINDDMGVIRLFVGDKFDENYRVYVCSNGKHKIASLTDDGWVPASKMFRNYGETYAFVNIENAVDKSKRIQYAFDAVKSFSECDFVKNLITTLNVPEVEQFVKLGCEPVAKSILYSSTHKADLKDWFGAYDEKAKNILNKVYLTKPQLDIYMKKIKASNNGYDYDTHANYKAGLKLMRRVFGTDLRHMDNQSFEKYLVGFAILDNSWTSITDLIERCLNVDMPRFLKNIVRIGEKNKRAYQLVRDTLGLFRWGWNGPVPEFDWYFEDYSDIVRVHDTVTTLKNEQEARRRALYDMEYSKRLQKEDELRIKLDKERKKYEYEDAEFIIRLPRDSQEIINEGSKQSICIGGYTTRHSIGETNLFFLRKKNDAETPFYAIEMNNNSIVQIHGYCNKWLGNNPEAIPTVVRWLRQHGIRCDDKILTCTAVGYRSTNNYIEMPIVD